MALDPRYVTGFELEQYFVDKTTGAPLAGGRISFFQDDNRVVPKNVFELTGAPPNYTYAALPNPITLSAVGTIQDAGGNNIALYAYPYDANGNLQLYYVTVTDALGVPQFTREAWPGSSVGNIAALSQAAITNQITNPQFAEVLFIPSAPLVINVTGAGAFRYSIAPGWILNVTATGATTVTLTRTSITGVTAYPFNPPYTLTITPGLNIAALSLSQRFENNPSIWSPQHAASLNGWLSASILLAPLSSVTMLYAPSVGAQQVLLAANNVAGIYAESNATVQLTAPTNTDNSNVGYVDIILRLPVANPVTFSNVQIASVESNIANVAYEQTSVARQIDQMFHYYNPLLQYKPIPSWLIGWDFPFNPTQFLGPTLAASAAGANTSRYVWDGTIIFQTANNGPAISRAAGGALRITATNASQFALVQYTTQTMARKILNDVMSVNISALTSVVAGLIGTISLWYTTDAALPSCAANNSIVLTLDANGKPVTFNGNWLEVPRSNLGNAQFAIATSANTNFNDYGFNGWDLNGIAGVNTATFFAIVVGFAQLPIAQTIDFNSISLCSGNIPTRPGAKPDLQQLADCGYFYQKSFTYNTIPATGVGAATGEENYTAVTNGAIGFGNRSPSIDYPFPMLPPGATPVIYNPVNNNAQIYDTNLGADCSTTVISSASEKGFNITCTGNAGTVLGNWLGFHWTADQRLGK